MRRSISVSLVLIAGSLAACNDPKLVPTAPQILSSSASFATIGTDGCINKPPGYTGTSPDPRLWFADADVRVKALINALWGSQDENRESALSMWKNLTKDRLSGQPLQSQINNITKFTLNQLGRSLLQAPSAVSATEGSLSAVAGAVRMLSIVYSCVELSPTSLPEAPEEFDGNWELVAPGQADHQLTSQLGDATVFVRKGSFKTNKKVLLVIAGERHAGKQNGGEQNGENETTGAMATAQNATIGTPFEQLSNTMDLVTAPSVDSYHLSVLLCPSDNIPVNSPKLPRAVIALQRSPINVVYLVAADGGSLACPNGAKAIGGTIDNDMGQIVAVDPYLETEVVIFPIAQPKSWGDAVSFRARVRVKDVPTNPAAYRGSLVSPDAVNHGLYSLQIDARIDEGAPARAATTSDASEAHWTFNCVNVGTHTAVVEFPEAHVPGNAPLFGASAAKAEFTVQRRNLVIAADDKTRAAGAQNPPFTGTLAGVQRQCGDVITLDFTTPATSSSPAGKYEIVPTAVGARLPNYTISANNGTLTVVPAGPGVAATGMIVLGVKPSDLVDGETFTLSDGISAPVTFEFDFSSNGSVALGHRRVGLSAGQGVGALANEIGNAINASGIGIVASTSSAEIGIVRLVNKTAGERGNAIVTETVADNGFVVLGMSGGSDVPIPPPSNTAATGSIYAINGDRLFDGETFTLTDGIGIPVTFEFDQGDGVTTGHVAILFVAGSSAETMRDRIIAAINGSSVGVTAKRRVGFGVELTCNTTGPFGNQSITRTVSDDRFIVLGMSGGVN
jgi:hypothetical protein